MIKLTNILSESVGDTLNLATPVNRKILSLLYRYQPELKKELKNYYRDLEGVGVEFKRSNMYKTIETFMVNVLGITDEEKLMEIHLLFLINPDVNNPKEDELFDGSNLYLTFIEYADDEIEKVDEEENVDCQTCYGQGEEDCYECNSDGFDECGYCNGSGNEECTYCDGSGEIEDEDGEEGDTLVCDECDGRGNIDCYECDGRGTVDCSFCGGDTYIDCYDCGGFGYVAETYKDWSIIYHNKKYLSFEPLDYEDLDDGDDYPTDMKFLTKNESKKILYWVDDYWVEHSRDGDSSHSYEPNEFISSTQYKLAYTNMYMLA